MDLKEKDGQYIAHTYKRFPVVVVRGKGSLLYDEDGKEYIDLGSGIGVTAFGAADEIWQKAVTEQISLVQHTSNLYYTKPCVELAEMLCERTGFARVFFSNSGAEANECAVKVARKYAFDKGSGRSTVVTLQNSFHGRTLTTLAATGQDHYHELFRPLTPGFVHTPAGDLDALDAVLEREDPCAVLMEMIQGEGGVVPLDEAFVRGAFERCRKKDVLFMVDEVQTGNGRTGRLYAYENFGVLPDVVSTAKGLAGGLPLGATLLSDKVKDVLGYGDHGSTFGGNPVSCAAAVSVLSRIDEDLLKDVREKGAYLKQALSALPGVKAVTGMGLMLGIQTEKSAAAVVNKCLEKGVLCLTAKDKVRLLPALNVPCALLKKAVGVIAEAVKEA